MILENNSLKLKGNLGRLTTLEEVSYEMYEMVFHLGSEHRIEGTKFDLEIQIYYQSVTPGHIKNSAALSILFKIFPGATNLFFDNDINLLDLPDRLEPVKSIVGDIDLSHLFMQNERDAFVEFSYYEYEGSITAPPCREDTTWYIVSDILPISYTTIETIKDSVYSLNDECLSDLLLMSENVVETPLLENIRNIQPINQRKIFYYESPIKKDKVKCKKKNILCNFIKSEKYENLRKLTFK